MVSEVESLLGVLTATKRDVWAEARQRHFSSGTNKSSLIAIEGSAFVLILDDEPYDAQSEVWKMDKVGTRGSKGSGLPYFWINKTSAFST